MKKGVSVAVVGATGAVGQQLLHILEERNFPVSELRLFASPRSAGKTIVWNHQSYSCRALEEGCFEGVQLAFFDASDAISKEWVPQAAHAGAWVVDNSATFRLDSDVLLIVPEVNGELLEDRLSSKSSSEFSARERIITGPNCSTVQMVVALRPIRDHWGLNRVVVSTYQSTSGAGAAAMTELTQHTQDALARRSTPPIIFPHSIAFNCIPHIGGFKEDGYTSEELKMIAETRKLLQLPQLRISATAVRVPTYSSHSESINVECLKPFEVEQVRSVLGQQPGLVVEDTPQENIYPLAKNASGRDAVYVGRIRRDSSVESGLNLWVVSDNLRKGAALNAVQIGEVLLKTLH
jgi:aspartate-semialdehyde dehydrogenase